MSVALSVLTLSAYAPTALATNSTITDTVGWVADPTGRGTLSLIFSCLLTLGLCVWSAMHLNIPPRDELPAKTWMRDFQWGLTGVVAPELVVFAAWRQYNSAKALQAEVQRSLDIQQPVLSRREKDQITSEVNSLTKFRWAFLYRILIIVQGGSRTSGSEYVEPIHPWTMVHSFYAGMGGFIVELDVSGDRDLPFLPETQCLTLTARGIAFLARCGHLPNIHKDDIDDKSKADSLAKSLVCVQASWMVVQVIGRVALGLPVTLLEVNILGHVLCAFVIYLLWWHKPRLVHEPTKLEGDWVRPLCAYMYMSSQVSGWKSSHAGILRQTWIEPELSALAYFTSRTQGGLVGATTREQFTIANTISQDSTGLSLKTPDASEAISDGTADFGSFGPRPVPSSPTEGFLTSGIAEQGQKPSTMQLTRWRLAAEAVHTYPAIASRFAAKPNREVTTVDRDWLEPLTEELVTRFASNWPAEDLLRGTGGLVMGMVLWCASVAYGGVHIAAWNDYFPSTVEAWMWRSSAIYITFSGFLWFMINLLAHLSKPLNAYWDKFLALRAHRTSYLILGALCSICGVAYAFARIFLVVEAFISIRKLPYGAYLTPNWTQIIPHL